MAEDRGSEFTGLMRNNGIAAKKRGEILLPWEQLRLLYRTGQVTDPTVLADNRRAFTGWRKSPDSVVDDLTE